MVDISWPSLLKAEAASVLPDLCWPTFQTVGRTVLGSFLPFTHYMQAFEDFVRFRIRYTYPILKRCYVAGSVPGWRTFWVVTHPWYFMSCFIVCVFDYRCFPSQTSTRTENIFTVICLSLDGFIWNQHNRSARLVEHCTGVVEVMGSNPAQASVFFFQALFSLLLLTL